MKIIFLGPASNIHTVKWVNSLSQKGIEVILVSLKNHKEKLDKINRNIKVSYLPISGNIGYYLNFIFLNKIIKKEKPDILNVHYASGYGTLGRMTKFDKKILNVWGSDVYLFPNESKLKERILEKNLMSYRAIASTSYCMANEVKKYLKVKRKIFITPFGVDTNVFKKIEDYKEEDKIIIGTVKTLEPIYGIEYLIRGVKELQSRIKDDLFDKIEVHIYGKGYLENELRKLVRDLKLEDKIKFYGYIKNENVPLAINKMDIFVIPSLSESFGVAAIEAMSCEVPVIGSDADGLKEIIEDNKDGFIVKRKDVKAIANKLEELIKNKCLRIKFGKQGRKKVLNLYNWDKNVQNMIDIYMKVIKENPSEL